MSKHEYLLAQLDKEINRFQRESSKHKTLYRTLRYLAFGLTACSTALASLAMADPVSTWPFSLVILLLTIGVGIITSIEGLRKPAELWIHERMTYYALKDLKRELEYRSVTQNEPIPHDEIFDRMQSLLGASGEKWSQQIARKPTVPKNPD